jgi:hypothetical protein
MVSGDSISQLLLIVSGTVSQLRLTVSGTASHLLEMISRTVNLSYACWYLGQSIKATFSGIWDSVTATLDDS